MKKLPKNIFNFIERLKQNNNEISKKFPNGVVMSVIETNPQEAFNIIIDTFLGENWYVVDPLNTQQTNTLALDEILYKYNKAYKKEVKKYRKMNKK